MTIEFWAASMVVPAKEITLQGRVVCVDQSGEVTQCSESANRYALRTDEGEIYYFLETDSKSRMFDDPRVRERELQVKAWLDQKELQIVKVYSLRNGQLYDIHYYCDVCQITAYSGGPCWCCQREFKLVEEPVSQQ